MDFNNNSNQNSYENNSPQYSNQQYNNQQYNNQQYGNQQYYGQSYDDSYNQPPKNTNGYAIASMVLGIISCALVCIYYIALIVGIIAIALYFPAKKRGKNGMATAGLICGIVGTAISGILLAYAIIMASTIMNGVKDFRELFRYYYSR